MRLRNADMVIHNTDFVLYALSQKGCQVFDGDIQFFKKGFGHSAETKSEFLSYSFFQNGFMPLKNI
jgi:hypothetical protein